MKVISIGLGLCLGLALIAAPVPPRQPARAVGTVQNDAVTLKWNTFLGGAGSDNNYGWRNTIGVLTADGGILVTGSSSNSWGNPIRAFQAGSDNWYLARLDSNGNLRWNTFLGGKYTGFAYDKALTSNGDVFVVGVSGSSWGRPIRAFQGGQPEQGDGFVARFDTNGNLVWNTFLGGAEGKGSDAAYSITLTPDGGALIAGASSDSWGNPIRAFQGGYNYGYVARLDTNGNLIWHTFLGGTGIDYASSIALAPDGGSFVLGNSTGASWGNPIKPYTGIYSDRWVARLDANGNLKWNSFGLSDGSDSLGLNGLVWGNNGPKVPTPDGGFLVAATRYVSSNHYEMFLAQQDATGNVKWKTVFEPDTYWGFANSTMLALDGAVIVVGESGKSWGNPVKPHKGKNDVFIARFEGNNLLPPTPASTPPPSTRTLYAPVLIKDFPQPRECDAPGLDCGEPNDQAGQAYGPLQLSRSYYATVGAANDAREFYHLNLQAGNTYEIMLNFDGFDNPANADLDIVVRRNEPPNYAQITFSSNQGLRFERFSFTAPSTGSYLFVIDSAVSNVNTVYTLQVQKSALAD